MLLRLLKPQSCVAAVLLTVALLFCGCMGEPAYPLLLCQADSAYQQGRYHDGDSLLACYDSLAATVARLPAADGRPVSTAGEATGHYRLLLSLEQRFVGGMLTTDDFSPADSLVRYYNSSGTREKHAKALLFLGDVYRLVADNPSALKCYLQAGEEAKSINSMQLRMWIERSIGDTYFDQRMLGESKEYYRNYYRLASICQDTLRMAYAAQRMGRVYTVENNVDSTLFCYRQSMALSELIGNENIYDVSRSLLCDILIQVHEFETAATIMPHDTLNDENWAFWHYEQQHADSAAFYFKGMLGKYSLYAQVQNLRALAQIEEARGNTSEALSYYSQLAEAEDSLREFSQTEETRRIEAQYNYRVIAEERDNLLKSRRAMVISFASFLCILLVACMVARRSFIRHNEARQAELQRSRLLLLEKERSLQHSNEQLDKNKAQLEELQKLLDEAKRHDDAHAAATLAKGAELLTLENQQIENRRRLAELKLDRLKSTPLYRKIQPVDGSKPQRLSQEEWQQLAEAIDDAYDHFTSRLSSFTNLKSRDLQICYLIKLDIAPAVMAAVLCCSKPAITLARQRMWKKITGREGTSAQLDEYIKSL